MSMIRLCACTKGSASLSGTPRHRESSKSCKSCGGKLSVDSVDGRSAQSGTMLSTFGLELSSVIDPQLNWKTASNGRQRAVRRARTSFTGGNRKKPIAKSNSEGLTDKNSKIGDMPVSESEKLGVSILGRRFSETLESVPIKKRRFLLVRSPSPPHGPSSPSDGSDQIRESQTASHQETALSAKQVLDDKDGKTCLEEVNVKHCDNADFSGISILAAAACDSNMGGEFGKTDGSVSEGHASEKGLLGICAKLEKEELQPCSSEDLDSKLDLPSKNLNEIKQQPDGSCNLDKSMSSAQSSLNKTRIESSSRDDRLHWDLNTVMDVWETHCDEDLKSEPLANNLVQDGVHDEKLGNLEPCNNQLGFADTKNVSDHYNGDCLGSERDDIVSSEELKIQEESSSSMGKPCAPAEEDRLLENTAVVMSHLSEETKPLHDQEKGNTIVNDVISTTGVALAPLRDTSLLKASALDEKAEAPEFEMETSSSHVVSYENMNIDHTAHDLEAKRAGDKENSYKANTDEHLVECCTTDVEMGQETHSRSPQAEKHGSLCIHSETGVLSCETAKSVALDKTEGDNADKTTEVYLTSCAPDVVSSQGLCTNGELPSGSSCVNDTEALEMKLNNSEPCFPIDESLNDIKVDLPAHIGSDASLCNSTDVTHGAANAPPCDRSLISHVNGHANSPGQRVLEERLDRDYYSDASQNDTDQAVGMERVEFLGDDDQYEDGEFRESFVNSWGEDGAEEGETEHVDYGSDRDTEIFDAASDFPTCTDPHVDNVECKNGGRDGLDASLPSLKCSSLTDVSDAGSGKRSVGSVGEKVSRGHLRINEGSKYLLASEYGAATDKSAGDGGFLNSGGCTRETSRSVSSRMKFSGWDQLPEGCRSSRNGVVDSRGDYISKSRNNASLEPSGSGESVRRVFGSSLRRDLSSRIERAKSSDLSHRNDRSCIRASRSNDPNDFDSKVERDIDASRSTGRNETSLHLQRRGRGDHWVDSPIHGNNRHDSSGYYGPSSFPRPGSRNAAAAAVAKVESNGFVVEADGTIVKAGGVGPANGLARRPAKVSSQSSHRPLMGRGLPAERDGAFSMSSRLGHSREMSPDRHMSGGRGRASRYGPGVASIGPREKYRGPMHDHILDSSSSMQRSISRRDRSFSPPHQRRLHLSRSHTRSPSRSRTRSPQRWTSPRGRSDNGMNGDPGLRPRSRSPNFKSESRMERTRPGFGERMVTYASSARSRSSPPHASRWSDGRKDLSDHFRDHEYKQSSGRSPPVRAFSRGSRFDPVDSPARLKSDDYYRSMHSGRFPEFVGYGRGSRQDGSGDDRRGQGGGYGMLRSGRQYDIDGSMKRFRFDGEDGFRAHNPRSKYSEFQRRESPSAFDRGTERQLEDSPQRDKEEKSHFRHGRDGKPNGSATFKSFGVQDCDEDLEARRRRPS